MSLPASLMNRFSSASAALTERQRARMASERVNAEEDGGTSANATVSSDTASLVVASESSDDANRNVSNNNNGRDEENPRPLLRTASSSSEDDNANNSEEAGGAAGGDSTYRTTMTLAELEEERELARRRMSACILLTVFVLFKLWIDCIEEPNLPLLMVCLIGTSWTARWIRYNREREEELDRRIAQYLQANNNNQDADAGGVMDRNDLRMLSFQAQLALAIMESQRHMMEGGRPDAESQRGVSDAAKERWQQVSFHDTTQYGSVVKEVDGPHCSICLGEYEEGEKLAKLPCQHLYHRECIDSWTSNHTKCPLCNLDLEAVATSNATASGESSIV